MTELKDAEMSKRSMTKSCEFVFMFLSTPSAPPIMIAISSPSICHYLIDSDKMTSGNILPFHPAKQFFIVLTSPKTRLCFHLSSIYRSIWFVFRIGAISTSSICCLTEVCRYIRQKSVAPKLAFWLTARSLIFIGDFSCLEDKEISHSSFNIVMFWQPETSHATLHQQNPQPIQNDLSPSVALGLS